MPSRPTPAAAAEDGSDPIALSASSGSDAALAPASQAHVQGVDDANDHHAPPGPPRAKIFPLRDDPPAHPRPRKRAVRSRASNAFEPPLLTYAPPTPAPSSTADPPHASSSEPPQSPRHRGNDDRDDHDDQGLDETPVVRRRRRRRRSSKRGSDPDADTHAEADPSDLRFEDVSQDEGEHVRTTRRGSSARRKRPVLDIDLSEPESNSATKKRRRSARRSSRLEKKAKNGTESEEKVHKAVVGKQVQVIPDSDEEGNRIEPSEGISDHASSEVKEVNLTKTNRVRTRHAIAREANAQKRMEKDMAERAGVLLPKPRGTLQNRLKHRTPAPGSTRVTRQATRKRKAEKAVRRRNTKTTGRRKGRSKTRSSKSRYCDDGDDNEWSDVEGEDLVSSLVEEEDYEGDSEDDEEDEHHHMEEVVLDGEDGYSGEDDSDSESESDSDSRKRSKNKKKRKLVKKSARRKRTRPTDAFASRQDVLSEREQRARLEFLVKQSADIARDLHRVMAEAATKQPPGTGAKSPSRKQASQGVDGGDDFEVVEVVDGDGPGSQDPAGDNSAAINARAEEKLALPTAGDRELQAHQLDGVKWLLTLDAQGLNAILADEMGLGKTIQAVTFLASLLLSGSRGPHLVVAPKNVCAHWATEIETWYPGQITVVTHLGNAEERMVELKAVLEEDNFDILVTSYEIAMRDLFTKKRRDGIMGSYASVLRAFRKVEFEYMVIDEAHRLKNDVSKFGLGVRQYEQAQRRLLLTGTPLSNNLKELWSLMNVLNPRIFSSKATFETWFAAPFENGKGQKKGVLTHAEQSVIVDRLHTIIRPFFRRRVRADICPTYTSADEVVIRCPMSNLQRALMLHFRRRSADGEAGANNTIMAMRKVGCHPFMSSDALFDFSDVQDIKRLVANSGKFTFLYYGLPRLLAGGHRVLIFCQFRETLNLLEDLLDLLDIKRGRLDGMTGSEERLGTLRDFNAPGSELQVFLLTTRAGGVGLNLQTADTVILFDSDWNPSADLQAVSRIQRIGQKRTVHIMRLITERSVDAIILESAQHKLRTQALAVGAGKFNTSMGAAVDQKMRQKDLEDLLRALDVSNFMPIDEPEREPVASSVSSPESLSPNRLERDTKTAYYKRWAGQLLRRGETSLPEVEQQSIWVEGSGKLPVWLEKDAHLLAAGKAMLCQDGHAADFAYKQTVQSTARIGAFSKKDRASRACRNVVMDLDSDGDSGLEIVSEDDPSVSADDCSDASSDENSVVEVPEGTTMSAAPQGNSTLRAAGSVPTLNPSRILGILETAKAKRNGTSKKGVLPSFLKSPVRPNVLHSQSLTGIPLQTAVRTAPAQPAKHLSFNLFRQASSAQPPRSEGTRPSNPSSSGVSSPMHQSRSEKNVVAPRMGLNQSTATQSKASARQTPPRTPQAVNPGQQSAGPRPPSVQPKAVTSGSGSARQTPLSRPRQEAALGMGSARQTPPSKPPKAATFSAGSAPKAPPSLPRQGPALSLGSARQTPPSRPPKAATLNAGSAPKAPPSLPRQGPALSLGSARQPPPSRPPKAATLSAGPAQKAPPSLLRQGPDLSLGSAPQPPPSRPPKAATLSAGPAPKAPPSLPRQGPALSLGSAPQTPPSRPPKAATLSAEPAPKAPPSLPCQGPALSHGSAGQAPPSRLPQIAALGAGSADKAPQPGPSQIPTPGLGLARQSPPSKPAQGLKPGMTSIRKTPPSRPRQAETSQSNVRPVVYTAYPPHRQAAMTTSSVVRMGNPQKRQNAPVTTRPRVPSGTKATAPILSQLPAAAARAIPIAPRPTTFARQYVSANPRLPELQVVEIEDDPEVQVVPVTPAVPPVLLTHIPPPSMSPSRRNRQLVREESGSAPEIVFVENTGRAHRRQDCFPPQVIARLKNETKIEDIEFLVDALLACNGNVHEAADYIYSHVA